MSIYSVKFLIYILAFLLPYYFVNRTLQQIILFAASLLFVGLLSVKVLVISLVLVGINYIIGIILSKYLNVHKAKKYITQIGVLLNIGVLVFYKYLGFIIDNINSLIGFADKEIQVFDFIIPIGISYYSFQGIGYILNVSRGVEKVEKNFIHFTIFMLFFPKFMAGPIERSKIFLAQLKNRIEYNDYNLINGFQMIIFGAFMKMVIGDRLALMVNYLHNDMQNIEGAMYLMIFILQPLHLYFDFSGYTRIALGIGKLFGLKLTDNFNRPFFSRTVGEFWKRWHISLSAWCNDYIFNYIIIRRLKWRKWASVYAVFVTFFVIGIWHGPNWTYVMVGLLQGIAINYEFFTKRWRLKTMGKLPANVNRLVSMLFTFLFFCLTLVFFNAYSLKDAFYFLSHMFSSFSIDGMGVFGLKNYLFVFFGVLFFIILEIIEENRNETPYDVITKTPKVIRWGIYYMLTFLVLFHSGPQSSFVYMQF
jgi:D-alanyl-lipoteichoic acid acyltransferase DltB (MBOAT superfamily)